MAHKIEISVILPLYNQASILPRVLSALHTQTIEASQYEVIVVDDGSSDGSKDALLPFLNGKGPRTCYHAQGNRGAAAARNFGVRHARGTIILLLDADEVAEPNFIQEHLTFHKRHGAETEVALGRLEMAEELMTRTQIRQHETRLRFDSAKISLVPWHYFRGGNLSIKKSFFAECGGFDETMQAASCEDTEFGFRLMKRGMQLYYLGGAVAHHYHPMDADMYLHKARAYGRSMARWYRKSPETRTFLTRFYGLPARETSHGRSIKYYCHRLIFNRWAQPYWMACAAALRIVTVSLSDMLYRELYKAMYRRAFLQHLTDRIVEGEVQTSANMNSNLLRRGIHA